MSFNYGKSHVHEKYLVYRSVMAEKVLCVDHYINWKISCILHYNAI